MVSNYISHCRRLIDVLDREREYIGHAQVPGVGRRDLEIEAADLGIVRHAGKGPCCRIEVEPRG